jgi:hypothetical protein
VFFGPEELQVISEGDARDLEVPNGRRVGCLFGESVHKVIHVHIILPWAQHRTLCQPGCACDGLCHGVAY